MKKSILSFAIGFLIIVGFGIVARAATSTIFNSTIQVVYGSTGVGWIRTNPYASIITDFGPTKITGSKSNMTGYDSYLIVNGIDVLKQSKDYIIATNMSGYMNMGKVGVGKVNLHIRPYKGSTQYNGWTGIQRFISTT